jgi:tripartite-type tricarboxylate transporter receptor subunit TctC
MTSIYAPAKTPAAVIQLLNREIVRIITRPESKQRLLNAGADVVGSSAEELAAAMKSEMARLGQVIKSAGIRAD